MLQPGLFRSKLFCSIRRGLGVAGLLGFGCAAATDFRAADRANPDRDPAAAPSDRVVMMQRFVVSAARIEKNPWRHAALPGFEVLSRASDESTQWL